MTKNTTKKTSSTKASKAPEAPKPMDPAIREEKVAVPTSNHQRVCWAVKTLVAEVLELFPETLNAFNDYDGRNTALSVSFDMTGLDAGGVYDLTTVLNAVAGDERVAEVLVDEAGGYVRMKSSPRTQDSRESFKLADVIMVLAEDDEGESEGLVLYVEGAGTDLFGGGSR